MNKLTIVIGEEAWFVATDTASGIASQGKTIREAVCNLQEALDLYCEIPQKDRVPEITNCKAVYDYETNLWWIADTIKGCYIEIPLEVKKEMIPIKGMYAHEWKINAYITNNPEFIDKERLGETVEGRKSDSKTIRCI